MQSRNFGCTGPNEEDIKQLPRTFSLLLNLGFAPAHIPTGCVQRQRGLSHGLKQSTGLFFNALSSPLSHTKKSAAPVGAALFWCERGDSNPHGVTTRTSNVLVYHSNTLAVARVL